MAIHDVGAATVADAAGWRELVAGRVAGPACPLVVPRYHDLALGAPAREWLEAQVRRGDEVVLHGLTHLDRHGRDGAELRGLPAPAVRLRVREGVAALRAAGLAVDGFIAPAYGHGGAADAACRAAGLRWWATRTTLRWRFGRRWLPSVGLGASSASKRAFSPAASKAASRLLAGAPVVRLDLHPADLGHPHLVRAALELLDRLLAQGRRPVVHSALLPGAVDRAA